ncbi:hypothetical protein [Pleomorphochaeta sp. DL1XJH-081]|jgi:SMC interacting uncharacterized protein involved in chromosome segregation|uniref:hypothetical protein n=1 Tax=Pleomorphochaeta sp. DL1XJH-081 TaxID=3409690 RepID=UPI003BB59555
MTLRDIRKHSIERMDAEVVRLEKDLQKMRSEHESLQQSLFDITKKAKDAPDALSVVKKSEELKKRISDSMVDIHHLDAKISRIKHRAERLRRNG